jgi:hypothetical protein
MKDPIVEEVRKYRIEHTQRFGGDLHRICEDLRKKDQTMKHRLVQLSPRKLPDRANLCVAEEPAEYKAKPEE